MSNRHKTIAAFIIALSVIFLMIFISTGDRRLSRERIETDRLTWFLPGSGSKSVSRFGYLPLYTSSGKLFKAEQHLLPWTPDINRRGKSSPAKDFFLLINAPERRWKKLEAEKLAVFIQKGGSVLIVTPSGSHYENTKEFLEQISSYQKIAKPSEYYSPYIRRAAKAEYTSYGLDLFNPHNESFFIRADSPSINFSSEFKPLAVLHGKNIFWKRRLGDGEILWLNAVLPGFNGERGDLVFKDSAAKRLLKKYNVEETVQKAVKERFKKDVDFDSYFTFDQIEKNDPGSIASGLSFVSAVFSRAAANGKRIIFYDYMRDRNTNADTFSMYSSGSFYAVLLITIFLFSGLVFFVRGKINLEQLRELKLRCKRSEEITETDPAVMRQARSRFAAQYIQCSTTIEKQRLS